MHADRRTELAGTRLAWLFCIIAEADAIGLQKFTEKGRIASRAQPDEVCKLCNKRIAARSGRPARDAADDVRQAVMCEVSLRWYCNKCCSSSVAIAAGGLGTQTRARAVELVCCQSCRRALDAASWRAEPQASGLTLSAAKLSAAHEDLSEAMTDFASALAQLEGLSRTAELQRSVIAQDGRDEDASAQEQAVREALIASRAATTRAHAAVEAALRRVSEVKCPAPPCRDCQLREALLRHVRRFLEDRKPRMLLVEAGYK